MTESNETGVLVENSSNLHWVGAHFVFFLDIPWVETPQSPPQSPLQSPPVSPTAQREPRPIIPVRALTVGVLEEVMGCTIQVEPLLSQDASGSPILSGDGLARIFVPWAHQRYADARLPGGEPAAEQWGGQVQAALTRATAPIQDDIWPRIGSIMDHSAEADVLCAIIVLLSSVCAATYSILWEQWDVLPIVNRLQAYPEILHVLRRRIDRTWQKRNGDPQAWLDAGFPFIAYMTTCEPTTVNVATIDTATYRPKHCTPECDCPFVKPSFDRVRELLGSGDIPVIVWNGSEIVVRGASEGPYVAISHVWADGLGSNTESGLPRCQIARLADRAGKLVPGGAYWLDALCVPDMPLLRKQAILLMARTYEDAEKVLVSDGAVRTQCSLSSPPEECALRIGTSGWMRRIWTLQEGMLARELYFEVSDGMIDFTFFNGGPFRTAQVMIPLAGHRPRDQDARRYYRRARDHVRYTVNDLVPLLRYRSTSKPEDEPIAISGLLGVDAGKIIGFKTGEERMKALLIEAGTLNRQLGVYGWTCNRLSLPNFGWAPTSLSEVIWAGDGADPLVATCTAEGFLADYYVLHFPTITVARDCGIVTVLGGDGAAQRSQDLTGSCSECGAVRDAPRVVNITLSEHLFDYRGIKTVVANGIVMKHALGSGRLRDDGVAVVMIDDLQTQLAGGAPLRCKFVVCGSATAGFPNTVKTRRTRTYWAHVPTTEMALQRICLI